MYVSHNQYLNRSLELTFHIRKQSNIWITFAEIEIVTCCKR